MKTELLGNKIRGKIGFLRGEKETQGVRREIFHITWNKNGLIRLELSQLVNHILRSYMIYWRTFNTHHHDQK
jgi:hypothetical protein